MKDEQMEAASARWQKKVGLGTRNLTHIFEEGFIAGYSAEHPEQEARIKELEDELAKYKEFECILAGGK